jgi:hypothetical protein
MGVVGMRDPIELLAQLPGDAGALIHGDLVPEEDVVLVGFLP